MKAQIKSLPASHNQIEICVDHVNNNQAYRLTNKLHNNCPITTLYYIIFIFIDPPVVQLTCAEKCGCRQLQPLVSVLNSAVSQRFSTLHPTKCRAGTMCCRCFSGLQTPTSTNRRGRLLSTAEICSASRAAVYCGNSWAFWRE